MSSPSSSPESLSPTQTAPTNTSAHNSPPTDPNNLAPGSGVITPTRETQRVSSRASQHLQTGAARVGSRSPSSIPSSPTSVHSSSSAIFERDIEPIATHSPPHTSHGSHPPNPHRIPRAKGSEQLDQSVPSVLDSAAEILTSSLSPADEDQIAIVAPSNNSGTRSGVASPIGSFRSRSPSPLGNKTISAANRASLLLSIPSPPQHPYIGSPFPQSARSPSPSPPGMSPQATARPTIVTNLGVTASGTPPAIVTPTSAYYSTTSSTGSSPTTTTVEHPPQALPRSRPVSTAFNHNTGNNTLPLPPSPTSAQTPLANKRLSFMSYSDLLTSIPAATLPLSSLTSSATNEPPPHIPSVSGLTQMQAASHSSAASVHGLSVKESDTLDDVIGGEWEREGLGRGLEERLEALNLMAFEAKA